MSDSPIKGQEPGSEVEEFKEVLKQCNVELVGYEPGRPRCIHLVTGKTTMEKFRKMLSERLGAGAIKFPSVFEAFHSVQKLEFIVEKFANAELDMAAKREIPEELKGLRLNINVLEPLPAGFFVSDSQEQVSKVNGQLFVRMSRMSEDDAISSARKVYPVYEPHLAPGICDEVEQVNGFPAFNVYTLAPWRKVTTKTKDKALPPLFDKLVKHLFPLPIEQEFFFNWLHESMFNRAMTYLVLCGAPGVGKNRLKLVMRALHGASNTVDGKRSTLTERFNSQLTECTLLWFDELSYDNQMENTLKEIQNDTLAIERKGIDATRATRIFASSVISNNKPRDNHIAMDARKFVPLRLTKHRLEKSMTSKEIDLLSRKVADESSPDYDPEFIAQIAKWIKVYGKSNKWPNQEYRGPMFYYLAHTSMSRWQKEAVIKILDLKKRGAANMVQDKEKGFLWSPIHKSLSRQLQSGNKTPDYSTVSHFLAGFVDATGKKIFKITKVPGDILGDFYVKQLKINVEINIDVDQRVSDGPTKKESDDL